MNSEVKTRGKIYTPDYIVCNVCDMANYKIGCINRKHVIDNSCGDGAFLKEIVRRYILDFLKLSNDKSKLKKELETFIHGIEIDGNEAIKCKVNLNKVANEYNLFDVNFDIVTGDSILVKKYNKKMDFVLGNPPYVRVHNFGESYDEFKGFHFSQGGMTDLYLVFYEIGINMLNKKGKLSYIAPSSFFTSLAGSNFREWIVTSKKVKKICDLKHFQPFNATTYTAIVNIDNEHTDDSIDYYEYEPDKKMPFLVEHLSSKEYNINGNFYFSKKEMLTKLYEILNFFTIDSTISVKNGFATLADKVFIGNFNFESNHMINILKISTSKWAKCIYPYDCNGKLISLEELMKDKKLYEYLINHKNELCKRDSNEKSSWYGFGRTQAIADVQKNRIAVNSLFRNKNDVKINFLPKGTGAYSGLYILSDFSLEKISEALINNDFINYISLLGKYKSGGYYTCSSKDIKKYLDYYFYKSND